MKKHIASVAAIVATFVIAAAAGCAHPETQDACQKLSACEDVGSCIGARESNLGEIGGRCGDAGTNAALAVYTCQGTLTCDNKADYATTCATQLAAYNDVRNGGSDGCKGAPDPIAP